MNANSLPDSIRPSQLITHSATLEGEIPIADLPRLADALFDTQGHIYARLQFAKDEEGIPTIKGTVHAELRVLCQRCMQPFGLVLDIPVSLSPITNDLAAKNLPEYYDPLYISKEPVSLRGILEEELLLNLPLVAKHEPEKCTVKLQNSSEKGDNNPQ